MVSLWAQIGWLVVLALALCGYSLIQSPFCWQRALASSASPRRPSISAGLGRSGLGSLGPVAAGLCGPPVCLARVRLQLEPRPRPQPRPLRAVRTSCQILALHHAGRWVKQYFIRLAAMYPLNRDSTPNPTRIGFLGLPFPMACAYDCTITVPIVRSRIIR